MGRTHWEGLLSEKEKDFSKNKGSSVAEELEHMVLCSLASRSLPGEDADMSEPEPVRQGRQDADSSRILRSSLRRSSFDSTLCGSMVQHLISNDVKEVTVGKMADIFESDARLHKTETPCTSEQYS